MALYHFKVKFDGEWYHSLVKAAELFGVSYNTMRNAVEANQIQWHWWNTYKMIGESELKEGRFVRGVGFVRDRRAVDCLTIEEVSKAMNIKPSRIWQAIARGTLQIVETPLVDLVHKSALDNFTVQRDEQDSEFDRLVPKSLSS